MAKKSKPKSTPAKTQTRAQPERPAPSAKGTEMGEWEQGDEETGRAAAPAGQPAREAARARSRQEERHGGIPIGSDPRE